MGQRPPRLSPVALAAIRSPANEVFVSVICPWELAIKSQLGKLALRLPLRDVVAGQRADGLLFLDLTAEHALAVLDLPAAHRDPFDRLLAAQSVVENAVLVTSDRVFAGYPVRTLW